MRCINCKDPIETPAPSTANKYNDWCDNCWIAVPQIQRWPKVNQADLDLIEQDKLRQERKKQNRLAVKNDRSDLQQSQKSKSKSKKSEATETATQTPDFWDYQGD